MHQYDQFKQDMEKLHKADLQNPIMANRSEPDKPNSGGSVSNRTAPAKPLDSTVPNLFRFDRQQTIPNCTVITLTDWTGSCGSVRTGCGITRGCGGRRCGSNRGVPLRF